MMPCQSSDELKKLVDEAIKYTSEGKVADYIPELGKANPHDLSIAINYPDGKCMSAGNIDKKITLQSISKVISLALVLMERGDRYVFERVGMEPTGDPFNSMIKLETVDPGKPLNPMINAGALVVTHMIKGNSVEERFQRLLSFIRELAGDPDITYNHKVAHSEFETAYLNRSLCYFLKQHHTITEDVETLMDLYTKQCAIEFRKYDWTCLSWYFI